MAWEKYQKARAEVEQALFRQIANMRRSMTAFDGGALEEAERLAASIYVIFHDGGRQKSLLSQLGLKTGLKVLDSSIPEDPDPHVVNGGPPLLGLYISEDGLARYRASGIHDWNRETWIPFSKWWSGEVYSNAAGLTLSRMNLIFYLRSQDGGAHVDETLRDEAYYRFVKFGDHVSTNRSGTLTLNAAGGSVDTSNVHWESVRQIASEVRYTLARLGYGEP